MDRVTYQSTIDEIKKLKEKDTKDKLINDTLEFEHLENMGLNTKNLTENFETFIKAYFKKLEDDNIKDIFYYFYTEKDYNYKYKKIDEYNGLIDNFQKGDGKLKEKQVGYGNLKETEERGNIRWVKQYTLEVLVPYLNNKIKIYTCKNKISRRKDDIQTVLDELKKLKTIDTENLTSEKLGVLSTKIISIIKKYNYIIEFFDIVNSIGKKETIEETLKKLENKPSESQYRQYTYQKS